MSAIVRAYNDWLAEFCRTDPARLKGIAMINLDDVEDGIKELERPARLGLSGAMITEYPLEHRRYDGSEYEPFLGRRRGARYAAEPPHGHATAGQDPRGRRQDAARREQPRDKGVLSGAVDVRSDLLRRLRASSPPHPGHRPSSSWRGVSDRRLQPAHPRKAVGEGPLPSMGPAPVRFAPDSSLEGAGFEPSVPPQGTARFDARDIGFRTIG